MIHLTYKNGAYIRQWEFAKSGHPEVVGNAFVAADLSAEQVQALTATAATIEAMETLERDYAASLSIIGRGQPEGDQTYDVVDENNVITGTEYYPRWQAYNASKVIVANVSSDTLALHIVRKGAPDELLNDAGEVQNTDNLAEYGAALIVVLSVNCEPIVAGEPS